MKIIDFFARAVAKISTKRIAKKWKYIFFREKILIISQTRAFNSPCCVYVFRMGNENHRKTIFSRNQLSNGENWNFQLLYSVWETFHNWRHDDFDRDELDLKAWLKLIYRKFLSMNSFRVSPIMKIVWNSFSNWFYIIFNSSTGFSGVGKTYSIFPISTLKLKFVECKAISRYFSKVNTWNFKFPFQSFHKLYNRKLHEHD